jgi:NAD(P)H-hydrate epimerase
MATGGSGDVLSGIIVSLLGQGLSAFEAAACGAWLHGAAGDLCSREIGQYGMLPSDMIQVLPRLLK